MQADGQTYFDVVERVPPADVDRLERALEDATARAEARVEAELDQRAGVRYSQQAQPSEV